MRLVILFTIYIIINSFSTTNLIGKSLSNRVSELLRNRIEAADIPPKLSVGEEIIFASVMLPRFYENRIFSPAWNSEKGPLPQTDELINAIRDAGREGLRSVDYHLVKIESTLSEVMENKKKKRELNPRRLVDLDLLLTDAFLIYGSHLLSGRVNPETIDAEWFANRREANLAEILQKALDSNNIYETLQGLLPPQSGYKRLREALIRYKDIAQQTGWLTTPEGPKLQKGDKNNRVVPLRKRLKVTGDLEQANVENDTVFDGQLEEAVMHFQKRHGLNVDGIVGLGTLNALNVSVQERINQIEINMERWRWLPQDLGNKHLIINIANFELDVVENNKPVLTMRAIVGKSYRRTPVFSDKMTYLVLCPYWHVPQNIAAQDILPLVKKDSLYFRKQNMKVFEGWGNEAKEIDPETIDWSSITTNNFKYRFRQEPGPNNALGDIKFMFPNQFNVYLHDTPARELFKKSTRGFSSGCIRIEKPTELAEYVLSSDQSWNREKIRAAINRKIEQTVRLPEPIPIHLLYWTSWVSEDGTLNFRDDIYSRDRPLVEALHEEPSRL
jgi:murein L,D-transpeptidase YcbB/YkuD